MQIESFQLQVHRRDNRWTLGLIKEGYFTYLIPALAIISYCLIFATPYPSDTGNFDI